MTFTLRNLMRLSLSFGDGREPWICEVSQAMSVAFGWESGKETREEKEFELVPLAQTGPEQKSKLMPDLDELKDVKWSELAGKRMKHVKGVLTCSSNQFCYVLMGLVVKGFEVVAQWHFARASEKRQKLAGLAPPMMDAVDDMRNPAVTCLQYYASIFFGAYEADALIFRMCGERDWQGFLTNQAMLAHIAWVAIAAALMWMNIRSRKRWKRGPWVWCGIGDTRRTYTDRWCLADL